MRIFAKSFTVIALAVPLFAASGIAMAEKSASQKITTTYEVYAGELRFLNAQVQTMLDVQGYRMTTQAQTVGAWATLLPWEATAVSGGKFIVGRIQPKHYTTTVSWRQQPKTITMNYADNGEVTYAKKSAATPKESEHLDRAQTAKTLDPLSGVLQMLTQVSAQDDCTVITTIFDGKQRIDVKVTDQGIVALHANAPNSFSGAARQCLVTFKSDPGKKSAGSANANNHLTFWRGLNDSPPVTVWLVRLRPDLPMIPVRAATTCPLGVVTAQLTGWSHTEQPVAAKLFARTESEPR